MNIYPRDHIQKVTSIRVKRNDPHPHTKRSHPESDLCFEQERIGGPPSFDPKKGITSTWIMVVEQPLRRPHGSQHTFGEDGGADAEGESCRRWQDD